MQSKRECEVSDWRLRGSKSPTCEGGLSQGPQHYRQGGGYSAIRHSSLPFLSQQWCERVNPENKAALEAWVRETGIRLVQVNGQRKYGGPPPGTVALAPSLLRRRASLDGPSQHPLREGLPRGSAIRNP